MVRLLAICPDRILLEQSVRRADCDFVSCRTFHLIGLADHELVRVSLRLANKHTSLAGYWKYNTSLLKIKSCFVNKNYTFHFGFFK